MTPYSLKAERIVGLSTKGRDRDFAMDCSNTFKGGTPLEVVKNRLAINNNLV
jgi:hypothetical protein